MLSKVRLRSGGMAFSQELKVEAYRNGFRCAEMPIAYYPRGGETKNRTICGRRRQPEPAVAPGCVRPPPSVPGLVDAPPVADRPTVPALGSAASPIAAPAALSEAG